MFLSLLLLLLFFFETLDTTFINPFHDFFNVRSPTFKNKSTLVKVQQVWIYEGRRCFLLAATHGVKEALRCSRLQRNERNCGDVSKRLFGAARGRLAPASRPQCSPVTQAAPHGAREAALLREGTATAAVRLVPRNVCLKNQLTVTRQTEKKRTVEQRTRVAPVGKR